MSKFTVGTKWKTIFDLPIEVIAQENMKKGQPYIHFQIIGSNPPRFLIRYESECKNLRPLEE
jgi:hypothetical protein